MKKTPTGFAEDIKPSQTEQDQDSSFPSQRLAWRPEDKPHPLAADSIRKSIVGYCDRISVRPGETVRFFASTYSPGSYRASLVRVINGDGISAPDRFKVVPVETLFEGTYAEHHQPTFPGSYVRVTAPFGTLDDLSSFSVVALVNSSIGKSQPQYVVSRWDAIRNSGWALGIDERGEGAAWLGDGLGNTIKLRTCRRVLPERWTMIGASFDMSSREFRVYDVLLDDPKFPFDLEHPGDPLHYVFGNRRILKDWHPEHAGELRFGSACGTPMPNGLPQPEGLFNGKIDGVRIANKPLDVFEMVELATSIASHAASRADVISAWDFSIGIGSDTVHDVSATERYGQTVNWPQRGMRGYHWKASTSWKSEPEEFTALYCHDDDLINAEWKSDFSYQVPEDVKSGFYAVRLEHGDSEHYIPFFIVPAKGQRRADIAFVVPTATYLAYSNQMKYFTQIERYPGYIFNVDDLTFFTEHPEFGASIYDNHTDGTPIQISSWLRPSCSITLKSFLHLVTADSEAIEWLEHLNLSYDVITEDMVHFEGMDLISGYRVLITGQHPEYNSGHTQKSLAEYLSHSGRIMYLGGNGFMATIAWHPELPILEIRKPDLSWTSPIWLRKESSVMEFDGTECSFTESWPSQNLGVCYQADTYGIYYMTGNTYYRLLPDATSPRVDFIFREVERANCIGNFGSHLNGAAGDEVDAFSPELGAPKHALELARSEGVPAPYWCSPQAAALYKTIYQNPNKNAYASVVFFETASGGAVFSVGSLAWVGALRHHNFKNDVERITQNVLRRFLDQTPFTIPAREA